VWDNGTSFNYGTAWKGFIKELYISNAVYNTSTDAYSQNCPDVATCWPYDFGSIQDPANTADVNGLACAGATCVSNTGCKDTNDCFDCTGIDDYCHLCNDPECNICASYDVDGCTADCEDDADHDGTRCVCNAGSGRPNDQVDCVCDAGFGRPNDQVDCAACEFECTACPRNPYSYADCSACSADYVELVTSVYFCIE
jgi:hypothetical protein